VKGIIRSIYLIYILQPVPFGHSGTRPTGAESTELRIITKASVEVNCGPIITHMRQEHPQTGIRSFPLVVCEQHENHILNLGSTAAEGRLWAHKTEGLVIN